jgi:succinyl-diaminopimelate desuccinylase
LLARLVNEDGKVQLAGFYDDVVPLTTRERQGFQALAYTEARFLDLVGVEGVSGESGFSILERRWARPSHDINGLWSGYQGEGAKTVLPARAGAKLSFRLVPDQQPEKVTESLRQFLEEHCPPGIRFELIDFHGSAGMLVPLDSPYVAAASRAIDRGFGQSPVYIREGGSIPIVTNFAEHLGADPLLLGWGQNDDNTHSPNEKFNLADYQRGIRASAYLWSELANLSAA